MSPEFSSPIGVVQDLTGSINGKTGPNGMRGVRPHDIQFSSWNAPHRGRNGRAFASSGVGPLRCGMKSLAQPSPAPWRRWTFGRVE
jgi:hypothetical protein